MRNKKGFSLIELLIVVAIILIIAAIAIPNLLRSRIAANESSAVGSMRTIITAEVTYAATYTGNGYAVALVNLGGDSARCKTPPDATSGCLIDNILATGSKSGYIFDAPGGAPDPSNRIPTFTTHAAPIVNNQTGVRGFCSDASGVLRYVPNNASNDLAGCDPTTAKEL